MKKRILAMLLAVVMVVALLPTNVLAAESGTHEHESENGYTELKDGRHRYKCSCGEIITENCTFEWSTWDDETHWDECDYCSNRINEAPHTMDGCVCSKEGCGYEEHSVETWTEYKDSEGYSLHSGVCGGCGETIEGSHDETTYYDETAHWQMCYLCGHEISREEHIMIDWTYYSTREHYRCCAIGGCNHSEYVEHSDEDGDGICDDCSTAVHNCKDEDGDHACDSCGYLMEGVCTDADHDHVCDEKYCKVIMDQFCQDENNDHICDTKACGRYMMELCDDKDGDNYCDQCKKNCCYHYVDYEDDADSNGDGTHTGICFYCGEEVVEECWGYGYYYDADRHYIECFCGYQLFNEEHSYDETYYDGYSVVGHWIECDMCTNSELHPHSYYGGVCDCGFEQTEVWDVYVAGIGLENGQYIDNNGSVTSQKPTGGYAYYKDGVLELNNYSFEGQGFLWREYTDYDTYYAAVFATKDITLKLTGENKLGETSTDSDNNIWGNAVVVIGNLTVKGEGSLLVAAADDGIKVDGGDFILESGNLTIGYVERDKAGAVINNVEVEDDGLDIESGDLIIKGGSISINSDDHGADVNGDVIISGGTVDITTDDDGLNVSHDITVTGGEISIDAEDYGFDSENGSVFISGGSVYIVTCDNDGIDTDEKIVISGGDVAIVAGEDGLEAGKVVITAGAVELDAALLAIDAGEIRINKDYVAYDKNGDAIEALDYESLEYVKLVKAMIVTRLAGATRYDTGIKAADELKEALGVEKFSAVIVAAGEQFADALSGSYLAAQKDAPILLVKNRDREMNQVKDYIKANLTSGGTVYLLGGEAAVSKKMETGLDGFQVKRLGGKDRYATNLLILQEAGVTDKDILVSTGKEFADALSASAVGLPILLVKDKLNADQKEFLKDNTGKIYIIGGKNAVSEKVEKQLKEFGSITRLSGSTRYETSVLVAETFFGEPAMAVIAYGGNFPDGLSGGPLAHAYRMPLLLTYGGKEKAAAGYCKERDIQSGYVMGGTAVLKDKTVKTVFSMTAEDKIAVK